MVRNRERSDFFSQVTLDHGPIDLLNRFILKAEYACLQRGVHLALVKPEELLKLNANNRSSWSPLLPVFDYRFNELTPSNSIFIVGHDGAGDTVACQAARHYQWSGTDYFEECSSLRLFYSDPERQRLPGEECRVSAVAAKAIRGSVSFSGAAWCRPDFRGVGLIEIMPRIARALAHAKWCSDFTTTMMVESNVLKGIHKRSGYANIEWDVDVVGSRAGTARAALLWFKQKELLSDLDAFLGNFDAEIELGIHAGRADE
jgi:hypothetical protein